MIEKPIHILVLSSWYPNRLDPNSGNFIRRFAHWQSEFYRISVIFVKADPSIKSFKIEEREDGDFHEILAYYPAPKGPFKRFKQVAKYKIALDQSIQRLKSNPDLIHAHVCFPKGKEFEYVSKKLKVDFILHEHSSEFSDYGQKSWSGLKRRLILSTLKKAKIVLAVSPFLERQILRVEPVLVHNVLPLPVDTKVFYPQTKYVSHLEFVFIHVSGLDNRFKNVKGIIEAFSRVQENYKNVVLRIVTDEDTTAIRGYLKLKKIKQGVEILENLSHEQIAEEYRRADCFVLFSEFETYSNVLVEAMSTGIQIITTEVGIVHDIDQSLVHIVPRKDVYALSTTMENALLTPFSQHKRDALLEEAKKYSREDVLERLRLTYRNVLQRYGR